MISGTRFFTFFANCLFGARQHARLALHLFLSALVATPLFLQSFTDAHAQRGLRIIRDAEIETLLRDYTKPIFGAAGLSAEFAEVVLINDQNFNAFVAGGHRIFMNTGVIFASDTPNEVIGVLAHETGHIAGGHLTRLRQAMEKARTLSLIATLLGAGALAAGAGSGSNGAQQAGAGLLTAGPSVAQNSFLAYRRSEEVVADRAGLKYLERTGQSARGMLKTFRRFADQELLSARYSDAYASSHPSARDRIALLADRAKRSPHFGKKDSPALQRRHDMMRAKLIAFTGHASTVRRQFPTSDKSLPALYARAIATMRFAKPSRAIKAIDGLIRKQPRNPYFHELKGQAYMEANDPRSAIPALKKAVSLAPHQGLIRIMLGHAMVASRQKGLLKEAVRQLSRGIKQEPNSYLAHQQMAIAHRRLGDIGKANLATANGLLLLGDIKGAKGFAKRAQKKLKNGSPGWIQARDILRYQQPQFARR